MKDWEALYSSTALWKYSLSREADSKRMTGLFVVLAEGAIDSLVLISFHRDDDRLLRLYCCQKSSVDEAVEQVEDVEEVTEAADVDLSDPREAFEERVEENDRSMAGAGSD